MFVEYFNSLFRSKVLDVCFIAFLNAALNHEVLLKAEYSRGAGV